MWDLAKRRINMHQIATPHPVHGMGEGRERGQASKCRKYHYRTSARLTPIVVALAAGAPFPGPARLPSFSPAERGPAPRVGIRGQVFARGFSRDPVGSRASFFVQYYFRPRANIASSFGSVARFLDPIRGLNNFLYCRACTERLAEGPAERGLDFGRARATAARRGAVDGKHAGFL